MATQGVQGASPYVASPRSAHRPSSRRSWFETPPATKLEIAVERSSPISTKNGQGKRRSIDEVETLVLTHFTKPPRIGFGKIVIGRSKTRILLLHNPAEYEQEVVVERFPYKKHFNVDNTHFVLRANEVVSLTLTWTPQDVGSCREMILFHINDVYRLQAYVFGSADNPKPARKPVMRQGRLMGRDKRQAPASVVQTKSLKSIQDSYSPRRSEELRDLRAQVKPIRSMRADQENIQPVDLEDVCQTPPPLESTAICKSDERRDQNALERYKCGFLSKMSPIPRVTDTANGVVMESYMSALAQPHTPVLNGKDEERSPLRTVSGNRNERKMSDSNIHKHGSNDSGGERGDYRGHMKQEERRSKQPEPETSDKREEAWEKATGVKEQLHQGSSSVPESKQRVSPRSFLNESLAGKTTAATPEVGCIKLAGQVMRLADVATVSPNSFLQDMVEARPAAGAERKASIPSPSVVLNDSIPHDIMVQHLEFVRKSLHDASYSSMSTPKSAALPARGKQTSKQALQGKKTDRVTELSQWQGRKMKMDRVTELSRPQERKMQTDGGGKLSQPQGNKMGSDELPQKRNVFVSAHQQQKGLGKKEKFLQRKIQESARFVKITDAPSPRRKTFLVRKQRARRVSPAKGQLHNTKMKNVRHVAPEHSPQTSKQPQEMGIAGDNFSPCGEPAATDTEQKEWNQGVCANTLTTDNKEDDASNLDDTITRRRRSLWASPALVAFQPFVIRASTDSESEEALKLESSKGQMSLDEADTQPVQSITSTENVHISSNETESKDTGRRTSGRRLFPDIDGGDLNLSSDFKPLWTSGSSTVTKDQPSVSLHMSTSGNTSKKLFPDISAEAQPQLDVPDLKEEERDIETSGHPTSSTTQKGGLPQFEFSSTPQLLSSPRKADEITRRNTLTVTKSHPSQALLQSSANHMTQASTVRDARYVTDSTQTCAVEDDEEEVWHTETLVIETRNSAIVNISMRHECFTPSQLPSSPNSENSRRSTHAVKNPVILSRDVCLPRTLFSAPSDGKTVDGSTSVTETATSSTRLQQQKEVTAPYTDQTTPLAGYFTDRMEHHFQAERHQVVKPSSKFSAQEVAHDNSTGSLELSGDSLELGQRKTCQGAQDADSTGNGYGDDNSDGFGDACVREGNVGHDSERDQNCRGESGNDGESYADSIESENPVLPSTDSQVASSAVLHREDSHLSSSMSQIKKAELSALRSVKPVSRSTDDISKVQSQTNGLSQSVNVEPVPLAEEASVSLTKGVQVSKALDAVSGSSGEPRAKLAVAQPVLPQVIKETLLKHSSLSDMGQITDSTPCTVFSGNRPMSSVQSQGQLRRSLSAEFRSKRIHPPQASKPPVAFTFGETKGFSQKAKPVSVTQPKGQTLVKSSSQSSLECRKQPERLNRKRSSPEAGLKESRSKRVELDLRMERKSQQSQGRAKGRPAAGRPAKATRGVPLAKLILIKKSKTALPKHPLPFAAKNMYYDERWQDKQERGFVHWLNFVLTPADEYMLATTKTKVDARSIAFDSSAQKMAPRLAPSKEVLSFRAYSARRRLNHLRRASCRLFQTENVVRVVCRLELEVEQRRLAVRTDRMIHADIGIKQKILDMLLSYNPLWLRIGLETVYGEVLPIQSNSDVIGMSRFILTRLLTSPDIAAHFSHPTVPHCYHDGYADAVAQHTMKKFLVLVYFLDCAKQSRLIRHDPCLFCKDAEIKSSKAMLVQFSRDFLSGEGDITKHLAYMRYVVSHSQTPLDEFDYAVSNLCVDLRDGLRLGRIVMLLSGDWSLASSLRAPAISRLQKIHNVDAVFKRLSQRGLDLSAAKGGVLSARDIVDGHREKTLAFLWKLIFHFQTVAMLNEEELREEVDMVERTLRVKLCMQRLLGHPSHLHSEPMARRDSGGVSLSMDNPMTQLLLKWCHTVCLHYGIKVENFTVSFSDGRALCCLVHHYHPSLLPLSAINFLTSQSLQEDAQQAQEVTGDEDEELSQDWGTNPFGGEMDQSLFDKLLANEKENFKTLYEKVSELGGIPLMLKAGDMVNTIPDERVVLTYLSYLCARLLDLREETRAARILQLAWRRFCLRRSARRRKIEISACIVIQRAWRQHWATVIKHRQQAAAIYLQAAWRGHRARAQVALLRQAERDTELHRAALTIQTHIRCFLTRQRHQCHIQSAMTIQTWWKAQRARVGFLRVRAAATTIQRRWRAVCDHRTRLLLEEKRREAAAIKIQSCYRGYLAVRETQALRLAALHHSSAVKIQTLYRMYSARRRLAAQREEAATAIQAFVRGNQQHHRYQAIRRSVILLQTYTRGYQARQAFRDMKQALGQLLDYQQTHEHFQAVVAELHEKWKSAIILQAAWKGRAQRERYQVIKIGATQLQAAWRGRAQRERYQVIKTGFTRLQAAWRGRAQRRRYQVIRTGITRLQAAWRGRVQRGRYQIVKTGVTRLQAAWRSRVQRGRYHVVKTGFTQLQAAWRGRVQRRRYNAIKAGITHLQATWRGRVQRRRYNAIKAGITQLQAAWRGRVQRRRYKAIKAGITHLQATWRGRVQRRRYNAIKAGITQLQAAWRGRVQRERYQVTKTGFTRLQAAWRGRAQRRRYQVIKTGATQLQAAWRGRAQRERYQVIRTGITRLQAVWRGRVQRGRYQIVRTGVTRLQAAWRSRVQRGRYHVVKTGVTQLQAAWRGRVQRRRYKAIKAGITQLQAAWRGRVQRRRYKAIKAGITQLQAVWRGRVQRGRYQIVKTGVTRLQAAWRGHSQRRSYRAVKNGVVRLQAKVRGRIARNHFLLLVQSATVVQRLFRARRLGQAARLRYQLMVGAAILIQSTWKARKVRSYFLQLRAHVVTAQAHCRRYLARSRFQKQRRAALCLQVRYRARVAGKEAIGEYHRSRQAIIRLQARVRGLQQRRRFLQLRQACVVVQAAARRRLAEKQFRNLRRATVTLQQQWKALVECRRQAEKYATVRKATVTIQSWVRGHMARRRVASLHQAAGTIQRLYRRHAARRRLTRMRAAATTVQRYVRAFLRGRQQQAEYAATRRACITIQTAYRGLIAERRYAKMRQSAIKIQAAYRSYAARQHFGQMKQSVVKLQAAYRGHIARGRYLKMRQSAVTIQSVYRSFVAGQIAKRRYAKMRQSAIQIQAAYRSYAARQHFGQMKRSVVKLQAAYRGHVARGRYLKMRQSAVTIQSVYRSFVAGQIAKRRYAKMRQSAIQIQAAYRSYAARQHFGQMKRSVVKLQAAYRGHVARGRYLKMRQSAVTIQSVYRSFVAGQIAKRRYAKMRQSAIQIQAAYRSYAARQHFGQMKQSVVKLQAAYRGYIARGRYLKMRQSAVTIQSVYRSFVAGQIAKRRYAKMRQSAIQIQAAYRSYAARQHFGQMKRSVVKLQAAYRGHVARGRYLKMRQSAVTIQSVYRSFVARQRYLKLRQSAVRIQAAARGFLQRRRYVALLAAVMQCQSRYRAKCLARVFRTAFLMIRDAAVVIQKHQRGRVARQAYRRQYQAAVTLQAGVRSWVVRQRLAMETTACVRIQRWWRARRCAAHARTELLRLKRAAVDIQRWWRGRREDRRQASAVIIQTYFRGFLARRKFVRDMQKLVRLQAYVRGVQSRKAAAARLSAVRSIQGRWRETLRMRGCRRDFLAQREEAVVLQSRFRGRRARLHFNTAVQRVTLLQAAARGWLQRRRYSQLQATVVFVQRRARGNAVCRRQRGLYLAQRRSAVRIQRAFRAWQEKKQDREEKAATCLQSYARMLPVRRGFLRRRQAAITLQAACRGLAARRALREKRHALIRIQRGVRFFLLLRKLRKQVHKRREAAVRIQRAVRGHLARREARRLRAAVTMQAAVRGFLQRRRFQRLKQATFTLQRAARGWKRRREAVEERRREVAAACLQRHYRALVVKRQQQVRLAERAIFLQQYTDIARRHIAVVKIQRWYRRCVMVQEARKQMCFVVLIQRRVRAFLQRVRYLRAVQEMHEEKARRERAALLIQSAFRRWQDRQREERRLKQITLVQALWRGRKVRCSLTNRKIAAARRRVQEANNKATEEKTLGNRTASALDFLLHYKQLAYILDALMHLDVATRLSWQCCERLIEVNAVGVIYRLIQSCNRSLPHMELIKFSISILLNLAKYDKTTHAVYEAEGSVGTLLDLMSIYRDNSSVIFTKTCMLLAILGSDPHRKTEMRGDRNLVDKLQSIHALVLRKHRMRVARARAVTCSSLNATLPSRLHGPKSVRVQPAWVLKRGSMYDIEDPLAALSFLMDTLHIGPKMK